MPRIADEALERIKREVSIADLARRRGIVLRGHGDNLIGLCPFHDDREPSLVITPSKNLWNCLGACNAGGDVIRWVELSERVPFRRAVELLHGGFAATPASPKRSARAERPPCPLDVDMTDAELLDAVVRYYEQRLRAPENAEAMRYLESVASSMTRQSQSSASASPIERSGCRSRTPRTKPVACCARS